MDANELGDFLAGFFAPLAFAWLAYAVVIQSKELAAQKEELRLTREEMKLTREVATEAKEATRAQADEARRSAELFTVQTELMREDSEFARRGEASEQFTRLLGIIRGSLTASLPISNEGTPQDVKEWFAARHKEVVEEINSVLNSSMTVGDYKFEVTEDRFRNIIAVLPAVDTVLHLESKLDQIDRAILKAIGIEDIYDAISVAKTDEQKKRIVDTILGPRNLGAK